MIAEAAADLADWSATDLIHGYRRQVITPSAVCEAVLARIEALNPAVNAFIFVDAEGARAAAALSSERWRQGAPQGLLDGVPVTVKDIMAMQGHPTRRGSKVLADAAPDPVDAPAPARLRAHGAVILGKTTTPEFGWKGVTDSALSGITRNPYDPGRTAGGSSGGAAAAAALGMGALHIGTDGGGSIRMPAGFCGIVGHKPTFGRVPAWPTSHFGDLTHIGPMTRTVEDAALMLTVLAEPDNRDWRRMTYHERDYRAVLEDGVRGWRVALCLDLGGARVSDGIASAVRAAADVFAAAGATVEEIASPVPATLTTFNTLWFAGAALLLDSLPERSDLSLIDPGLRAIADTALGYSAMDLQRAHRARGAAAEALSTLHDRYDLLLTPTLPLTAFEAGTDSPYGGIWSEWSPFTYPFNLSQQPACS
ncbi:MAG: amidase, partial [Geminicoccaceae bacterium]